MKPLSSSSLRQAQKAAQEALADISRKAHPETQTLPQDQVPAAYNALVKLALPGRKTVGVASLENSLQEALDQVAHPPQPSLWSTVGLARPKQIPARSVQLVDELLALSQLKGGGRYAQIVQASIKQGSR